MNIDNTKEIIKKSFDKLKVGDVMLSLMPNAFANALANTVLPLPKSPIRHITILGNFSDSIFWANSIVSSSE